MKTKINGTGCKVIMVQGTASSAGKSVVAAALCRLYARRGLRVAPFKAQNMSLNSCVTPDGLEMGRAQGMQAEAAGVEQDVRMNPILLKPTSDHKSQVIVMGRVSALMNAKEYYRERAKFSPVIKEAYAGLCAENDLIVIEGAGSPAEINLRENDLVNMGMAAMADAPVILVGDIDRGGVFASLYGTVKLLDHTDQARIKGLVINKFRGDVSILEPGLREIEELLGIPVLGVLPYVRLDIDEEDSLAPCLDPVRGRKQGSPPYSPDEGAEFLDVAIIRLPRISNFTDFAPLSDFPAVKTRYVEKPADLGRPHLVILPGTKSTMADLHFLRETGFEEAILRLARQGRFVIGICGGFQMLGKSIHDTELVEGMAHEMPGMGLLNMRTFFKSRKKTVRTECAALDGPGLFKMAGGQTLSGYEIHMGHSAAEGGGTDLAVLHDKAREKNAEYRHEDRLTGLLNSSGRIFGTYLHGFFDNAGLTEIIINNMLNHFSLDQIAVKPDHRHLPKQETYNKLADMIEENIDVDKLDKLIGITV